MKVRSAAGVFAVAALALGVLAVPAQAATVPGKPPVKLASGNAKVTVSWGAAASNGSTVTRYQVASARYYSSTKKWSAYSYVNLTGSYRSRSIAFPNGSTVRVLVRGYNAKGWGPWSSSVSTVVGLPGGVPGSKATSGNAAATVAWSAAVANGAAISSYRVYYRSLVGSTWSTWAYSSVTAGTRARTFTGLVNGRSYQFYVRALNKYGAGPAGATVSAKPAPPPDTTPPGPVTELAVATATETSIVVAWTDPNDTDLADIVVRRLEGDVAPPAPDQGQLVGIVAAGTGFLVDGGLAPGTSYSYAVVARDKEGNESSAATLTAASDSAAVARRCGALTANETWSPAKAGTYVLDCSVSIPVGLTLTLEPGTVVKAAFGNGLSVQGTLRVLGSASDPATFTSLRDDSVGGDSNGDGAATAPSGGDLKITATSPDATFDVSQADIRFMTLAFQQTCPSISCGAVTDSSFRDSTIALRGHAVGLERSTFVRSPLMVTSGAPRVVGNTFTGVDYPVTFSSVSSMAGVHGNSVVVSEGGTDRQRVFTVNSTGLTSGEWNPEAAGSGVVYHWQSVFVGDGATVNLLPGVIVKAVTARWTSGGRLSTDVAGNAPGADAPVVTSLCSSIGGVTRLPSMLCDSASGPGGLASVTISPGASAVIDGVRAIDTRWTINADDVELVASTLEASRVVVASASGFVMVGNTLKGTPVDITFGSRTVVKDNLLSDGSPMLLQGQTAPVVSGNAWEDTAAPLSLISILGVNSVDASNSAQGTSALERLFRVSSSTLTPGASWGLASVSRNTYSFEGISIPHGTGISIANGEIDLLSDLSVTGSFAAYSSVLKGKDVIAYSDSDVTITGSVIGGSVHSNPGGVLPYATVTVTGSQLAGGDLTNHYSDSPDGATTVNATGTTGYSSVSFHSHQCVWSVPNTPALPSYPRKIYDVFVDIPDDPPCAPGYLDVSVHLE